MSRSCVFVVLALAVAVLADGPSPVSSALRSQDRMDKYNNGNADTMEGNLGGWQKRNSISRKGAVDRSSDYYSSADEPIRREPSSRGRVSASASSRRPSSINRNSYGSYQGAYDEVDQAYEPEAKNSYDSYYAQPSSTYNIFSANRKTFTSGYGRSNPLALLVAPLAGIAFITAAAALAVSPAYLTISSSLTGRKKRDLLSMVDPQMADQITPELMQKIQELQTLEKFLSSIPKETDYQQQIMSMYLSCSGYMEDSNVCLDRVFCEYGNTESKISEEERDVLSIVLYNIMANNAVTDGYKNRLRTAARLGRDTKQCARYNCAALSASNNIQ